MIPSLKARARNTRSMISTTEPLKPSPTASLSNTRIIKATNQLRPLRDFAWNGFHELTDEATIGHVLFETNEPSESTHFERHFK